VYTTVNGSVPTVALYVNCAIPPAWIVLPVNVPTGRGFLVTVALLEAAAGVHVPLAVAVT